MSGWRLSAGDPDSPHCLGEVESRRLVDATFVLGELTCPSTLQYCYSFRSYRVFQCLDGDSPQAICILRIVSEKWSGGDSWILHLF